MMDPLTADEAKEVEEMYLKAATDPHCEVPHERMMTAIDKLLIERTELKTQIAWLTKQMRVAK